MSPAGRRTERARCVVLLPRGVFSSRLDNLEGTDEAGALVRVQSNKRAALTLLAAVPPAEAAADPGVRASLVRFFPPRTSPAQQPRHLTSEPAAVRGVRASRGDRGGRAVVPPRLGSTARRGASGQGRAPASGSSSSCGLVFIGGERGGARGSPSGSGGRRCENGKQLAAPAPSPSRASAPASTALA